MTRLFWECTVRAALIVLGTAIVLYAMRVKVASVRHRVWTAVLLLMLALPLWIVWGPKAPVRILPARVENFAAEVFIQSPAPAAASAQRAESRQTTAAPVERIFSMTEEVLLGIYLFGALIFLVRLTIGTAKARKLVRSSVCVVNPPGGGLGAGEVIYKSLPPIGVRCSDSCAAPVTVGCFRPTIVLPSKWRDWPESRLAVVLAHEREHVRRRDPLVQWLALFNRAIFWFHPAAWWLERELSALAEECCDAAVLAQGHDPSDYAETLMHMARAVMDSGTRVNVTGAAMPGVRLPERVRRIMKNVPDARMSRRRTSCVIAICAGLGGLFVAGAIAAPQSAVDSANAASLVFEAASVKESAPGGRRFGILAEPGGRLTANNATLSAIIRTAYDLNAQQMVAAPEFDPLLSRHFDIDAKADDDPTDAQMNLMLQALLADRFKLAAHHETRQLPVFVLVVSKLGKIGPQLTPHTDNANCPDSDVPLRSGASASPSIPCGDMIMGPGHASANKISMSDFAASLSGQAGRLVLDRTGLTETFDLTLKYTPEQQSGVPGPDAVTPDPLGPSLFTALQEQLGLKLDSQVAPVDVLVIDHVEEPTAN